MRLVFKLVIPIAVIVVLAAGLLPPLLDKTGLDNDALTAAKAASAALISTGSTSQSDAQAVVEHSLSSDPGVQLVSVQVDPHGEATSVQVTVEEDVHTFMSGLPELRQWLKGWFHLSATQNSSVGT